MCSCEVRFGRKAYELYALDCSAAATITSQNACMAYKKNVYTIKNGLTEAVYRIVSIYSCVVSICRSI